MKRNLRFQRLLKFGAVVALAMRFAATPLLSFETNEWCEVLHVPVPGLLRVNPLSIDVCTLIARIVCWPFSQINLALIHFPSGKRKGRRATILGV
jgi:hypothetical protein